MMISLFRVLNCVIVLVSFFLVGFIILNFFMYIYREKLKYSEIISFSIGYSIIVFSLLGYVFIYFKIGSWSYNILIFVLYIIFAILFIYFCFKNNSLKKILNQNLNIVLLMAVACLISEIIRLSLVIGVSQAPINYDGCYNFVFKYILKYNAFPPKQHIYGLYTQSINSPGGPIPALLTLNILLQKLINLPNCNYISIVHVTLNLRQIIMSFYLCVMLVSLLYSIISEYINNLLFMFVFILYALLGSSVLIMYLSGWNAGYGFVYISTCLFILYLTTKYNNHKVYSTTLLVFSLFLVVLYHTAALYYLIILFSGALLSRIYNVKYKFTIFLPYSVFFIYYLIYFYHTFGNMFIVGVVHDIFNVLGHNIRVDVPYHRNPFVDKYYILIYAISIFCNVSIVLFYLFLDLIKKKSNFIVRVYIVGYIFSLIVWFMYMGRTGLIHRGKEYLSYLSVYVLIIVLTLSSRNSRKLVKFLLIICVIGIITSVYVYYHSTERRYHLSWGEYTGSMWALKNFNKTNFTFTDLRLASNFVANGYLRVLGVLDPPKITASILKRRLNGIFYGNNSSRALIELWHITSSKIIVSKNGVYIKKYRIYYLFLSNRMAKGSDSAGIYGYDYQYRSAPIYFTKKYDYSYDFNRVYCNNNICIYTVIFPFK